MVKVQSEQIYGGYNPIGYARRHRYVSSTDNFIFSFENDQDIRNMKIGRVINTNCSIYEDSNNSFFNFGGHLFVSQINEQNLYLNENGYYKDICYFSPKASFYLFLSRYRSYVS